MKSAARRNRPGRRRGRHASRLEMRAGDQSGAVAARDARVASAGGQGAPVDMNAGGNRVSYPRFEESGACQIDYSDHVVGAENGELIRQLVAVPRRSGTVVRRAAVYRPAQEDDRFRRAASEPPAFPSHWDANGVLEWFSRGIAVMATLPSTYLYPARLKALALPVVREVSEAYGYDRARARRTADSREIAMMEATLAWPSLIGDVIVRKAFMLYAMGVPSARISRALGYKSRAWGKKLALDGAAELAFALNSKHSLF